MEHGTVLWIDPSSGEGEVQAADGRILYLHYTCIDGIDKNGYRWPKDADQLTLATLTGRPCQFTVYRNIYSERVEQLFY